MINLIVSVATDSIVEAFLQEDTESLLWHMNRLSFMEKVTFIDYMTSKGDGRLCLDIIREYFLIESSV